MASAASISATYVRKLEQGAVNDPSPRVLRQLARALDVPYRVLMDAAGYLDDLGPDPQDFVPPDRTDEDRRAVLAFIDFLASRRRQQ